MEIINDPAMTTADVAPGHVAMLVIGAKHQPPDLIRKEAKEPAINF
jgi:hypothetical protein